MLFMNPEYLVSLELRYECEKTNVGRKKTVDSVDTFQRESCNMNYVNSACNSRSYHENSIDQKPLYAVGKTQAYLLSLVAPTREIILVKPYNQVVEERLYADLWRVTRQYKSGSCQQF